MAILKYKMNGEWVELGGSGGSAVEVDPSLSTEGMAADAKATGDSIAAVAEVAANAVSNDILGEVVGALTESIGNIENQVAEKQNKIIFNITQPTDWVDGDVWLKPAE